MVYFMISAIHNGYELEVVLIQVRLYQQK